MVTIHPIRKSRPGLNGVGVVRYAGSASDLNADPSCSALILRRCPYRLLTLIDSIRPKACSL